MYENLCTEEIDGPLGITGPIGYHTIKNIVKIKAINYRTSFFTILENSGDVPALLTYPVNKNIRFQRAGHSTAISG